MQSHMYEERQCCGSVTIVFSNPYPDLDPTFQSVSDPYSDLNEFFLIFLT